MLEHERHDTIRQITTYYYLEIISIANMDSMVVEDDGLWDGTSRYACLCQWVAFLLSIVPSERMLFWLAAIITTNKHVPEQ